jgi:hypothetical protein
MISTGGTSSSSRVRCCGFGVSAGHAEHRDTAPHAKCVLTVGAAAFWSRHNDSHSRCEEIRTLWSVQNAPSGNGVTSSWAAIRAPSVSDCNSVAAFAHAGP